MKLIAKILLSLYIFLLPSNLCAMGANLAIVDGVIPISMNQVEKLLKQKDVYVFDANLQEVRDKYGHIPGAIFINTENWTSLLPHDKNATLVFYCLNPMCYASSDAAAEAMKLGYKNTYVMLDGIEQWIITGREVDKRSNSGTLIKSSNVKDWLNASKVKNFHDIIHSKLYYGEIPSCRDCHGDVKNGIRPDLAINKSYVNANCSSCHKEEKGSFNGSVHSQANKTKKVLPVCTDCHSVHTVKEEKFALTNKQLSDLHCAECHEKQNKHYLETFHGKAMYLNSPGEYPTVAACFDCHGKHNIRKPNDPLSTIYVANGNRIKTCSACHKNATKNFANGFIAHADHTDKKDFPMLYWSYVFMTALIVAVFGFFGLHTFMWSARLIICRLQHPAEFKALKAKEHADKVKIRRFKTHNIIMHFFVAASFLGLACSGLPQKFYTADWAREMINIMGGPIMATNIHHFCAIIMIACFLLHCLEICVNTYKKRDELRNPKTGKVDLIKALFGPDSLFPRAQDFKDMRANFMWFIGKGKKPQFDRWTYWEKFDYLAVFWGMVIIGFSGLVLWFPTFFGNFLPGWFINLSTLVHSDEALLATGFIFAVHFFNTHFRADRFPMDTVIFSGVITESELEAERKPWYDRLVASGKLSKLTELNNKFESYSWLAKLVGFAMLITGLIFLFLIIYAFVKPLLF